MKRKLGCIKDRHDSRDWRLKLVAPPTDLPSCVDLKPLITSIFDQGDLGSCTANAISKALQACAIKASLPCAAMIRSRLYIYYNEREIEGTINEDAGAEIRDGIKVVASAGACDELIWPYDISKFAEQPSEEASIDARQHIAISYYRVNADIHAIKAALAEGHPVIAGIQVYSSFMTSDDGTIPMPLPGESCEGGHAILITGYDDATQTFDFLNSWGDGWGQQGFGTLPYMYITLYVDDCWTIRAAG